jgi:hypothetical protein
MVAIDPSSARRRSRISLRFLTSRLIVIFGAVAGGVLLVHLREQLLFFGGHETIVVEAPAYYNPGIRSRLFDKECRYYLAESAIPNGGLGIFSAISITHGKIAVGVSRRPENLSYWYFVLTITHTLTHSLTTITTATLTTTLAITGKLLDPVGLAGDICIYVPDLKAKTDFVTHSWAQDVFFGQFEGRNPRAACEGFATLFNSLPQGVQNSKLISPRVQTNAGLNPGAGAITQYFGIQSSATDNIQAGSELTIDYGDFPYDENTIYTKPERPVTWLREHGMCVDNIEIRPAGDPEMGRVSESLSTNEVKSYCVYLTFSRFVYLLCRVHLRLGICGRGSSWHQHPCRHFGNDQTLSMETKFARTFPSHYLSIIIFSQTGRK